MDELLNSFSSHNLVKLSITCLTLVLSFYISSSSKDPDVQGEALLDFLQALNDTGNKISDWNPSFVSPCSSWSHVTCRNENVVSVNLGSFGLSGTLSPSITKLRFLENLELQNNNLHGPLPDYLGEMTQLQNLNLGHNKFSGEIPASWGYLVHLKHLFIALLFCGVCRDLSSNELSGAIPLALVSTPVFNFSGNDQLACGRSSRQSCTSSTYPQVSKKTSKLKIITVTGSAILLLLALWALILYRSKRIRKLKEDVFVDVSGNVSQISYPELIHFGLQNLTFAGEDDRKNSLGQLKRFSWRELQIATDNFNDNNIIGHGGFGKVYKGILPDNTKIAVKRLKDYHNPGGEAAFHREVQLISVAVHRNLLRLIGFCTTSSERILIYPFMKNLSVANHLRDLKPGDNGLDWSTRKRVAFGGSARIGVFTRAL
uniref:Somatic embryogenesis receptor kinase 1-like protein n=1 Tax=Sedum alfredii TaxID=439688 RepID=A0A410N665_9MAGN|nr:somatic embryogenesis receptor kinase 1-like protein [Sedum alfredii]